MEVFGLITGHRKPVNGRNAGEQGSYGVSPLAL